MFGGGGPTGNVGLPPPWRNLVLLLRTVRRGRGVVSVLLS